MKQRNITAKTEIISFLLVAGLAFMSFGLPSVSSSEAASAGKQDFPQIKALFDHYHYTTEEAWGKWFEDNYPGELTASYLTGPLTYEELKDYDIFITYLSWKKSLGPQPTANEVRALEEYVRKGGGALLMGDDPYLDLWTNEYCSVLSQPYNISFNDDQLLDPTDYDITVTRPEDDLERHIIFHNIIQHPVTTDVSSIWAHGTCSLIINNPDAIIVVAGDEDTYSDRYLGYPKGSYPPAVAALEHGLGRILFSGGAVSYGADVYDNRTFIWNILKWLARPVIREELVLPLEFGNFKVGDIDGNGKNEIVMINYDELTALDENGNKLWQRKIPSLEKKKEKAWIGCVVDVSGDSASEIILNYPRGNLRLDVYDGKGTMLKSFDFDERFEGYGDKIVPDDAGISVQAVMDINGDGRLEAVATVYAGYRGKPRGVFVFDYETGEETWYYPIAGISMDNYYLWGKYPHICGISDLNIDGTLDIVVSTYASCNGNTRDGTDDCHCYVIVLDAHGNELLTKEIGEHFSGVNVEIIDINNDGYKEIVGAAFHAVNVWGRLFVLNLQGNFLYDIEFNHSIIWGGTTDFEDDGYKEIVVGTSQGKVTVYDNHLYKLSEHVIGTSNEIFHPAIIKDIDGNGFKEIIITSEGFDVIILDQNLEMLWRKHFINAKYISLPVVKALSREDNSIGFLILADHLYLYSSTAKFPPLAPQIEILQQNVYQRLDLYESIAGMAFSRGDYSLSEEYYLKMYNLYDELGNEDKKDIILDLITRIRAYSTEVIIMSVKEYLEEEDCENAKKILQRALDEYQSLATTQKSEEIELLNEECLSCEDAYGKVTDANLLIGEADKLITCAKENRKEHEYIESRKSVDLALKKYDEALEKIGTALQIYERIAFENTVGQMRIHLMEIEVKRREAEMEKKNINLGLLFWFGSVLIALGILGYWLYLSFHWLYKLEKSKHLNLKEIKGQRLLESIRRKRLHSFLGAALIACFFIILGIGSLPIIFLIGLFSASSFIYSFLFNGHPRKRHCSRLFFE